MPDCWERLEHVFLVAVDIAPDSRETYLHVACGGDVELRLRVEQMLEHDEDTTGDLRNPIARAEGSPFRSAGLPAGARIGDYRVERELGSGGMGTVYLAAHAEGRCERKVALKVVRSDRGSVDDLRRFRAEAKMLATLEHPSIARLIDAGATSVGLPYLVMEYVDGERIVAYCNRRRLGVEARLDLFLQACAAVRYVHRKRIVHRDIKPGNILVSVDGVPKLLDFGIAKLLEPRTAADPSPGARTATRMLTPDYASPEQVRGETVSTSTDVYSLGVLLYELLTGRGPYPLRARTAGDLERAICETRPARPSRAVIRTRDDSPQRSTFAESLGTTANRLRRRLRGDLDHIVLNALRKRPERRYASVDRFAEDVRSHLSGWGQVSHSNIGGAPRPHEC